MVVWVLTAGIGIYVLAAGMTAHRHIAGRARTGDGAGLSSPGAGPDALAQPVADATVVGAAALASLIAPEGGTTAAGGVVAAGDTAAGDTTAAGTTMAADGPATGDTTAVGSSAAAGGGTQEAPLLEFMHPLLALVGLTFWIFFVMTNDRLFAWIAFGVVVATVLAGLNWVIISRRAARRRGVLLRDGGEPGAAGHGFPAHLVMIHGLAATCTLALVVISAITAAHA